MGLFGWLAVLAAVVSLWVSWSVSNDAPLGLPYWAVLVLGLVSLVIAIGRGGSKWLLLLLPVMLVPLAMLAVSVSG